MLLEMPGYDGLEVLLGLQGVELELIELIEPVEQLLGHGNVLGPTQLLLGLRAAAAAAAQSEPLLLLLLLLLLAQLLLQLLYLLLLLLHLEQQIRIYLSVLKNREKKIGTGTGNH
jgi:hypothetical protein